MKRLQAFKFRIKPNGEQRRLLAQYTGNNRKVWNLALDRQQQDYAAGKKYSNHFAMNNWLPAWKKAFPFLSISPAQTLQQVLKDLDKAFKSFFEKRSAYPNFKKKDRSSTGVRYPEPKQFIVDEANSRIKVPKLGWIPYRKSRLIKGTVKNLILTTKAGHWYVSIQTQREVEQPIHPSSSMVGIDMGIKQFATLSDGKVVEPINPLKNKIEKLAHYQRRCARQVKFSKNWKKQQQKIRKLHETIANTREDFLHKASNVISKSHAIIVIEDLKVTNMSHSAAGTIETPGRNVKAKSGLNKAILDQGWGEFRRQLEYKSAWLGGEVIAVNPKNTSRCCPVCHSISKDNRKTQSQFECTVCGYADNADLNAALNILRAGHARLACQVNDAVMSSAAGTRRRDPVHQSLDQ
jgi:IS605 OrfB family transposase